MAHHSWRITDTPSRQTSPVTTRPRYATTSRDEADARPETVCQQSVPVMKTCFIKHHWEGCRCTRCGQTRDQDHDWDFCRCRRCGLNRHEEHQWEQCVCLKCGKERHRWHEGVCETCHQPCAHEWRADFSGWDDTELTAHSSLDRVCVRCGFRKKVERET